MRRFRDRHLPEELHENIEVDDRSTALLNELPDLRSIKITGMHEIEHFPTSPDEFYVDYGVARISFHPDHEGTAHDVVYNGVGSCLRADELNEMLDRIGWLESQVANIETKLDI
jgi:hypothetical protein